MKFLLYIWQLPQNLLGFILIKIWKAKKENDVWITEKIISGISLGKFIILKPEYAIDTTIKHEQGHQVQSKRWGPLYLLVVGIYSFIRSRMGLSSERYYSKWPENKADKLGGVKR